ncbi:MAG TPA: Stk1 family PASTA domain-containing Ser/Thr kinase [Ktedonobacterales bacterium]
MEEVIGDRYELQEPIGRGGMATIYRAVDFRMGRTVAVKILREVYSSDPKFVTRFQREARAASALQHPNIVQVFDYGQSAENYYIVMEFVEGVDLRRYLKRHGILSADRAIEIARDVALGLGAAHRRGIVHRDVKPQNVLLNDEGMVKLTDFGIASMYKDAGAERLTTTGMTLGTVQYYAPEQAQGEVVTPAADVYALGIVMYEMLTGRTPFDGDTPVAVAMRHIQDSPEPPAALNPRIPPALDRLIMRCLEKDPRDRFADGDALAAALENVNRAPGRRSGAGAAVGGRQFVSPGPRSGVNSPGSSSSSRGYAPPALADDYDGPMLGMGTHKQGPVAATTPRTSGANGQFRRPDGPQRGGAGPAVIVTAVVVLLFVSCFLAFQLAGIGSLINGPKTSTKPTVTVQLTTVPDFTGKQLTDAQTLAQTDHLQIKTNIVSDAGHPKNTVTAQDPPANKQVAYNSTVTLTVSGGAGQVAVPDEVGKDQGQACFDLSQVQLNCDVPADGRQYSATVAVGHVIKTSPTKGTQVDVGSVVEMYISLGPQATNTPVLPSPTATPTTAAPTATPTLPPCTSTPTPGTCK